MGPFATVRERLPSGVNEDELAALVRWGNALVASDTTAELRAAGKAIVMLGDEVERLHIQVWNLRAQLRAPEIAEDPAPDADEQERGFVSTLMHRLLAVRRR